MDFRYALNQPQAPLAPEDFQPLPAPQEEGVPQLAGLAALGQQPAAPAAPAAPAPAAPISPFELYAQPAPAAPAPSAPGKPAKLDMSGGWSFTEDDVAELARRQGVDPKVYRKALEREGATIMAPPRARAGGQTRGAMSAAGQAAGTSAGGGGGGLRGLLAKEIAGRQGEADAAAQGFAAATEKLRTANDALVGAQQKGMDIEAAGLQQLSDAQQKTGETVAKQQALDMEKRRQEDEAIRQQQQSVELGWKELQDATIDDRRSPTQKAMAVFSVALSGIADALMMSQGQRTNFQQNTMGIVDAQIQRDVDMQMEALGRKRENLTQKERALQNFRAQVGDDRAFRSFLMQREWENLGHLADQVTTRTQSDVKRNAAAELKVAADQAAAQHYADGMGATLTSAQERVRAAHDIGFQVQLKQAMGAGKPAKPAPSGYGLKAIDPNKPPNERDTEKAQELYQKSGGLFEVLDEFGTLADKGTTLSQTERQYAATLIEALGPTWSNTLGSGAPSETQLQSTKEAFLNPTEVNMADAKRYYQKVRNLAKNLTQRQMRPYGYTIDDLDVRPE